MLANPKDRTPAPVANRALGGLALVLVAALLLSVVAVAPARAATPQQAQWSAEEQQFVYELNRARRDPTAVEAVAGLAPGSITPQPPLAVNDTLAVAADIKSSDMADNAYFAHQSPVSGLWPNELLRSAGYLLPAAFPDDANNVESIHRGNPNLSGVLQSFVNSAPHRAHVMGQGWFGNHREVGVGARLDVRTWSVETAFQSQGDLFLTGVVFADSDGDGIMDLGEGLPGVTVDEDGNSTLTNAGGGWSLRVSSGAHALTASGSSFSGVSTSNVTVEQTNVEVDFVSAQASPQVYWGLSSGGAPDPGPAGGNETNTGTQEGGTDGSVLSPEGGDQPGPVEETPAALTVPAAPSAPQLLSGSRTVKASWLIPADGGAAIQDYLVQYRRKGKTTWSTFRDGVSADLYVRVGRLLNGKVYQFRVAAKNSVGVGPWSATAEIRVGLPTEPRGIAAIGGNGQVQLSWRAPASTSGARIRDYIVQYREVGAADWLTFRDRISSTRRATVTRLASGVSYEFRIAAKNSRGVGPWSAIVQAGPVSP